jgi:uncharacterized protein
MPGHEIIINAWEFATKGGTLAGRVVVAAFERLRDVLASQSGEIDYHFHAIAAANSKPAIEGIIRGKVELICQRCMGMLPFGLDLNVRLSLVERESELPNLADEPEDTDIIVADPQTNVMAWIEDEIILALPVAPRHDFECAGAPRDASVARHRPFSALGTLKNR